MTIADLLTRLERCAPCGKDRWRGLCPSHPDATPSLSVGIADDGRILLKCFAGCSFEAIIDALGMDRSDFRPQPPPVGTAPRPAPEIPPVLMWMCQSRRLPKEEAARVLAVETREGPAVVFRYVDRAGHHLYDKYRTIREKRFWRLPRGATAVLYGLDRIEPGQCVLVEGELDAHALRAVGVRSVVSLPDGANTRLTDALLAPLADAPEILIATDGDGPGDKVATLLSKRLGPQRCRRVLFEWSGKTAKDANDALMQGWPADALVASLAAARPFGDSPVAQSFEPGESTEADPYRAAGGRIFHLVTDRQGQIQARALTNFDARIVGEVEFDDGAESTRSFAVEGRTDAGERLRRVHVSAAEFPSMGWVSPAWGSSAIVLAGQGTKDHARAAIQLMSRPPRRVVYRHSGWREIATGRMAYLFHGGAVGAEGVEVELTPPLDRFVLPPLPAGGDLRAAVEHSLSLLQCGPPALLVPLLAAIYAAPLASYLMPDFSLWLHGPTGSFKSELAALAQGHFGSFERKTLPASWTSTENALEARLFAMKDALVVIDDYAPACDARSQQDQERRAQRVLRNIGNHASRGRLRQDLSQRPDRPPRAVVICTGEDLPPGASILARLVTLEVAREAIDVRELTRLQQLRDVLPSSMRGYIEWLRPRLHEIQDLSSRVSAVRDRLRLDVVHRRQPEAVAHLLVAFELFMAYATEVGAVLPVEALRRGEQAQAALVEVAERQSSHLRSVDPAEAFVSVLQALLVQGRIKLLHRNEASPPGESRADVIGWQDEEFVYLSPEAARKSVVSFMRDSGDHWPYTPTTLHRALLRGGAVMPGPDGRPETQARVGGSKRRVLKVPRSKLFPDDHPDSLSPVSPPIRTTARSLVEEA
jgi:hypothetical protein